RGLLLDGKGGPIDKRNPQDIRATVFARTIGPGKSDVARYALEVKGRVRVTARLRYRKFDPAYTRYAIPKDTPVLPSLVIAEDSLVIGERPASPVPLWERWNDYGAALLDQNDTRGAAVAFENVALLAP